MRKLVIAAVAAIAAIALASVAYAANHYDVHVAKTTPVAKGSAKKPVPIALDFGYLVTGDTPQLRATPIIQYRIGAEGLVTYPKVAKSCKFAEAFSSTISPKCKKAKVGQGIVINKFGASNDPSALGICNLKLTLYNLSDAGKLGGLAIRLDGDPPAPTDPNSRQPGCPLAVHQAIKAPYFKTKIDGLPASELRFDVPNNLVHPVGGVDNSVREAVSHVNKIVGKAKVKGKKRKVGFYSAVGCKGKNRTTRVQFKDESGTLFTANDTDGKC
jgi:hypothetical protein